MDPDRSHSEPKNTNEKSNLKESNSGSQSVKMGTDAEQDDKPSSEDGKEATSNASCEKKVPVISLSEDEESVPPPSPDVCAAKPEEVTQVMVTQNGHVEGCSSMNPPTGKNVIRPEPRIAQPQHHFPLPIQHPLARGPILELGVDRENQLERHAFHVPTNAPAFSMGSSGESMVVPGPSSPISHREMAVKTFGRKRSRKRLKICGVCGDRAKSFHFGGLSCDSCKAFFRRSVQNDANLAFRCAYDNACDINISTRKSCQYCRFRKCISIGMEKSWVMTEEERNALNQQRLEKKASRPPQAPLPLVPSPQEVVPIPSYTFQGFSSSLAFAEPMPEAFRDCDYKADVAQMLDYMHADEQLEIKTIIETYLHAYKEMPFRVSMNEGRRDTLEIIEMFTTILRRFAYFAKLIPAFKELDKVDQGNLLRAGVLEMCLIRGAACFDTEENRWPISSMESLKDCPQLRVEDMQRLVSGELYDMHITFICHMKRLRVDEPIAMLLIMMVLFTPERTQVENVDKVNVAQEKYIMLLKKYVTWKFGQQAGNRIYPQLLTKLTDLRQLNDFHTEFHLHLDSMEVNAIKKSLKELQLNPYPNWKIVPLSRPGTPETLPMAPVSQAHRGHVPAPTFHDEDDDTDDDEEYDEDDDDDGDEDDIGDTLPFQITPHMIQQFADERIPILLENPYAKLENDASLVRQVKQTLGALFPSAERYPSAFGPPQPSSSRGIESTALNERNMSSQTQPYERIGVIERSGRRESSMSPRHRSASGDTQDEPMDTHSQSSRLPEFASGRDFSTSRIGAEVLRANEYHSERLQQFLQQRDRFSAEMQHDARLMGVIRGHGAASTIESARGSQTVLRKHTSGSSLPGPSSVIRAAPSSKSPERMRTDFRGILPDTNQSGADNRAGRSDREQQLDLPDIRLGPRNMREIRTDLRDMGPDRRGMRSQLEEFIPDLQGPPDLRNFGPNPLDKRPYLRELLNADPRVVAPDLRELRQDPRNIPPDLRELRPDLLGMRPDLGQLRPDLRGIRPDLRNLGPDLLGIRPDLLELLRSGDPTLRPNLGDLRPNLGDLRSNLRNIRPDFHDMHSDRSNIRPDLRGIIPPEIRDIRPDLRGSGPDLRDMQSSRDLSSGRDPSGRSGRSAHHDYGPRSDHQMMRPEHRNLRPDPNDMRSINCTAGAAGWHGGEVHTSAINGHRGDPKSVAATRMGKIPPHRYDDEQKRK